MAEKIDIEASKYEDFNKLKLSDLNKRLHKIYEGRGERYSADVSLPAASVWVSRFVLLMPMILLASASFSQQQYTEAEREEINRALGLGGTPDWVFVFSVLVFWAVVIVCIYGYINRCKNCRAWWSQKVSHTEDLGMFNYSYTTTERRTVTSWSGLPIGYTNVPVEQSRTARRYRNTYCCKRCGHVRIGGNKTSR